jgi:hypothetical protein
MQTAMTERSLMVKCDRPDLGTKYAFFHLGAEQLVILYVNIEGEKTKPVLSEPLRFSDYPEAQFIHDGKAWNIHEVNCWVRFAERTEERTEL